MAPWINRLIVFLIALLGAVAGAVTGPWLTGLRQQGERLLEVAGGVFVAAAALSAILGAGYVLIVTHGASRHPHR